MHLIDKKVLENAKLIKFNATFYVYDFIKHYSKQGLKVGFFNANQFKNYPDKDDYLFLGLFIGVRNISNIIKPSDYEDLFIVRFYDKDTAIIYYYIYVNKTVITTESDNKYVKLFKELLNNYEYYGILDKMVDTIHIIQKTELEEELKAELNNKMNNITKEVAPPLILPIDSNVDSSTLSNNNSADDGTGANTSA